MDNPLAVGDDPLPDKNEIPGDTIAYIMYTSGSTGRPKGVIQTHKNVLYYTRNWTRLFSITASDRMTLFSSFCHDGSVQDMFGALLNGAALYPYDVKNREECVQLSEFLLKEKITIWHSVPSLFTYFANTLTGEEKFPGLRFILLGGEVLREHEINIAGKFFPYSLLVNVYGQTESSVNSVWGIRGEDSTMNMNSKVLIGDPMDETEILLVDAEGNEVDVFEQGEIVVCSDYLSPGYWRDPEATRKTFSRDEDLGRLYWTGDLGRLLPGGGIEFTGRRDSQIKIRGYRIELGEIENLLLRHEKVHEAVVVARERSDNEKYLVAYYTLSHASPSTSPQNPAKMVKTSELRNYLAEELPDYMIPSVFMQLDQFPLTQSKKIDRRSLPEPEGLESAGEYAPPRTRLEEKMVHIWADLLELEKVKISINANFFELGGHSLKVIALVGRVHKELNVKIPLDRVFKTPSIRELVEFIQESTNTGTGPENRYISIQPAEAKDCYALSSAQRRLYALQQMEPQSTSYNMIQVIPIEEVFADRKKLEQTFKRLIERHESLRTSFEIAAGEPVQKIHKEVEFKITNYKSQITNNREDKNHHWVRAFDLSKAPLLRVGLFKTDETRHLLVVDMHHIISDAISHQVLQKDFVTLFHGEELPTLKLQYKDYSDWQDSDRQRKAMVQQEAYWMKLFEAPLPVLNLLTDFPRPEFQDFEGAAIHFSIGKTMSDDLKAFALKQNVTLQMLMVAIFHVMLSKISGQEDIITGTTISGRGHADLERVIGLFANTLALRTFPAGEKAFQQFLTEIKDISMQAYQNQDYPFEDLVKKVTSCRDMSRNPLFDVMFEMRTPDNQEPHQKKKSRNIDIETSKFDQDWVGMETAEGMDFTVTYSKKLFCRETIELMTNQFMALIEDVLSNLDSKIKDLDYQTLYEKELKVVEDISFNF
jgi:amino acid adenylation domain-containing protein